MFCESELRHFKILLLGLLLLSLPLRAEEAAVPDAIGGVVRYVELKPTFIANFGISDSGTLKYVRADVTVRVSNKDAEYATRYHLAALRDKIVLLLSRQDESTVASAAGRETLKAEALEELRDVLEAEEGEGHIDDVMFTNFVVQR